MIRRLPHVLALVAGAAVFVAACGGGATASPLTDPQSIITAALTSTKDAKSFHVDATVDGSFSADVTGSGTAVPLNLAGTTASADVDIANSAAHATFAAPSLFGISGELIAVDGKSYLKTSLTGPLYQVSDMGSMLPELPTASIAPGASADVDSMVSGLGDFLAQPGVAPVKGDDVACGSKQCYTVSINLTPEELAALGAQTGTAGLPVDASDATIDLTVKVEKDTNHLAGVTFGVASPKQGNLSLGLTFSKWDEAVSISAPPADQVQPAS